MNLYEFTKKYGEGKGEGTMWATVAIISDAVESKMSEPEKKALLRKMYAAMDGKHYNEEFAREDIAKMYYTDEDGERHYAPYWTDDALRSLYRDYKDEIPDYNIYDWMVVMNMIKSDHCPLLHEWFPDDDEEMRNERIVRLALNWLKDDDNPFGQSKAWGYFNSK